jgi:hypothetical protein
MPRWERSSCRSVAIFHALCVRGTDDDGKLDRLTGSIEQLSALGSRKTLRILEVGGQYQVKVTDAGLKCCSRVYFPGPTFPPQRRASSTVHQAHNRVPVYGCRKLAWRNLRARNHFLPLRGFASSFLELRSFLIENQEVVLEARPKISVAVHLYGHAPELRGCSSLSSDGLRGLSRLLQSASPVRLPCPQKGKPIHRG